MTVLIQLCTLGVNVKQIHFVVMEVTFDMCFFNWYDDSIDMMIQWYDTLELTLLII